MTSIALDRRAMLAGAAGLAAAATGVSAQTTSAAPRTFVLVHGSWHGGWCYGEVAALLRAKGHRVYTPTLTGLADRSHLMSNSINLDTHIADVVNLIDWEDLDQIVLCGHSYGGMPVTGVADKRHDKIASLFLLDAFVPNDGQSLVDIAHAPTPTTPTEPSPPASAFIQTKERLAWAQSKLTPHPNGTRIQKASLTGAWLRIPKKTYVRVPGFNNPAFDVILARLSADPQWKTDRLLESGHDAMVDQPQRLANMLEASI
jgi:pimeloyl-ACP methyl ester carboxylesterase